MHIGGSEAKTPLLARLELHSNVWQNLLWATSTPKWMDDDGNDTFDSDSEFEMGI
jgi:hypothetical protein